MASPAAAGGVRGPNEAYNRVYLFNCPFEEKDDAKRAGAKWDYTKKQWYVSPPSSQRLEGFNRWHPNGRIYLKCSYKDKNDVKKAGARWDLVTKQWYINVSHNKGPFERWLPSSSPPKPSSPLPTPVLPPPSKSKETKNKAPSKKTTKRSNSQLATTLRINEDMTVTQLTNECKARDPSIVGLSNKNKDWLLDHLKVGSPWISAIAKEEITARPKKKAAPVKKKVPMTNKVVVSRINKEMTISQLQIECRARDPSIKGVSNKNKDWLLDYLNIGSVWKSSSAEAVLSTKTNSKKIVVSRRINKDLTISQLHTECHARDPRITGLSNKNKEWLLDHMVIGSVWKSAAASFSGAEAVSTPKKVKKKVFSKINNSMTISQLQTECRVRDPSLKGLSTKNKAWFLDYLKIGTVWKSATSE